MSIVSDRITSATVELSSLVELLRWRAQEQPERLAYTFLTDGETEGGRMTYSELDRRARAIAALLQGHDATGERVLILYPAGLEYVAAFLGCLYAGAVAVPAYPPRLNRSMERLQTIAADARAKLALTTDAILSRTNFVLGEAPDLEKLRWLATDEVTNDAAGDWRETEAGGETLAFLQYTSGSTATPRGVMLSHQNLLHNSALLASAFEYGPEDHCVSWLPAYHDMGLIGAILQPLYGGFPSTLMSPNSFLQRPLRWLQAISRYRGTLSGAPNFAYELCLRKATPEQLATLDLSSWSIAFNGAEPLRSETLDRFTKVFAPCGFRREAFYPCYGLAEATLIVSGSRKAFAPIVATVRAESLEQHKVVEASEDDESSVRSLVSCGRELREQKIRIVDPETLTACAPDEVGEIWVSGPSVARGYWAREEETELAFHAHIIETGEGPFLRTGDLGFIRGGELFVTGRLKDLIIIRGRNHYPQDIEQTIERCHASVRAGGGAAFAVEAQGKEQLVVVCEVDRRQQADANELTGAIRQAVAEEHEVQPAAVVIVKAGSISKTSSGKIQRHACRAMFLRNELETVAEWREAAAPENVAQLSDSARLQNAQQIEAWLVARLSAKLGVSADEIDVGQPITRFGADSLTAVELTHDIETALGISLPTTDFLRFSIATIAQLSAQARVEAPATSSSSDLRPGAQPRQASHQHPLSYGQQAMWFLHRLAPESPVYNLASAARVRAEMDVPAMRRALSSVVQRHPSLRTVFTAPNGEPQAEVRQSTEIYFEHVDAAGWSEEQLRQRLTEEAHRPFDLERGPLLRVCLFSSAANEHVMLLSVHHIVADFWSLAILMHELGELYLAETNSSQASLAPIPLQYSDYARRQAQMLSGDEGERLWQFWQKQLAGELPVLNLAADRPRPPLQTHRGASCAFTLSAELTGKLKALSREQGVTLYTTLLAAFQTLLHRYTHQDDVLVGSLAVGRNGAELAGIVGYFVNPIVLRADFSDRPTFEEFLGHTRRTVLDAFAHHEYPFPLLVERLQPARDPSRSPLFQAMFLLQKTNQFGGASLSPFALGEAGARIELGGLPLEAVALEQRVAQFDLTLLMAEVEETLGASLEYNSDLFDAATAARMAEHFTTLLESIVADPRRRLSELPLLSAAEHRQLITDYNRTETYYPTNFCAHELFEAQVAQTPDNVAVVFEEHQLTFAQLNARAN